MSDELFHREAWVPSPQLRRALSRASTVDPAAPGKAPWDARLWLHLGWVLVAVQASACVALVQVQGWSGAPALVLFALISAAGLRRSPPFPALFAFLFAAASTLNAAGWLWRLFDRYDWFDDILHLMTPFALVGGLQAAALRRGWLRRPQTAVRAAALGAAAGLPIGLAWEGLEAIFVRFPISDTLMDIAYDMAGAGLAGWLVWAAPRLARHLA